MAALMDGRGTTCLRSAHAAGNGSGFGGLRHPKPVVGGTRRGSGDGWVSLFDPDALAELLGMPSGARPVAVLCLGPVERFYENPCWNRKAGHSASHW